LTPDKGVLGQDVFSLNASIDDKWIMSQGAFEGVQSYLPVTLAFDARRGYDCIMNLRPLNDLNDPPTDLADLAMRLDDRDGETIKALNIMMPPIFDAIMIDPTIDDHLLAMIENCARELITLCYLITDIPIIVDAILLMIGDNANE
jgi:hypothetical protein